MAEQPAEQLTMIPISPAQRKHLDELVRRRDSAQTAANMAQGTLDGFVNYLADEAGISGETWELNLAQNAWVKPAPAKE